MGLKGLPNGGGGWAAPGALDSCADGVSKVDF